MTVVIKTGDDALRQVSAPGFGEAWESLYLQCPWAAPAQSLEFVTIWYEIYRERFSPVLVSESSRDGMLIGALPLAVSRDNGRLVVAGAHEGEYNAWISLPTDDGAFITKALLAFRQEFPRQTLVFKYLPPESPLDFLAHNNTLKRYCEVGRYRDPLLVLDERHLTESLRKKSNKSRIKRLRALGEVTFERVMKTPEAKPLMAEIATQYDLRQGGMHGWLPFQDDPYKKLFYEALLEKDNLLHFTVLKVGSSVLSAHLGLIDKRKRRVQLGVFSHSVSHARHSPGKLHILMLGMRLLKDGISVLDLTPPGGDYKERFASTHDEVFMLTMYGSRKQFWSAGITKAAVASGRTALDVLGIPRSTVRATVEKARRIFGFGVVGNLKSFWFHRRPERLYRYEFVPNQLGDATTVVSRDRLGDLLAFEPKQTWSTDRQGFLANACKRLEKGHHCYTYIDHGSLVYCGWLLDRYEVALLSDMSPRFQIPEGSALLVGCNINRQAREIGLFESCVKQMLHDAGLVLGTRYAYVSVLADDVPAWRTIEKLGFVYQASPGRAMNPS